jgi:glutamyl-tRNA synthetase
VIRGEDLLSSTPRQIVLAEALGRPAPPAYAHLPLIIGADRRKLSKRHGETALRWYRDRGYRPDAVRNFLALLGWGPPGDEKLSLDELVDQFDLPGVTRSAAIFDPVKLDWLNGVYIRDMAADEFARVVRRAVIDAGLVASGETDRLAIVEAAAPLVQERVRLVSEIPEMVGFLVAMPPIPPELFEKVYVTSGGGDRLGRVRTALGGVEPWEAGPIGDVLKTCAKEQEGVSFAKVQAVVRVAVSGAETGIPLFDALALLGREEALARLDAVAALLR